MTSAKDSPRTMPLYINPDTIHWMLGLTRLFLYPSYTFIDQLLCLYIPTVEDKQNGGIPLSKICFLTPCFCVLLVLTLPIILVFFPIRCLLLSIREPFELSVKNVPKNDEYSQRIDNTLTNRFAIATCNLCLMPESISRLNHLKHIKERSCKIGERIVADQLFANDFNSSDDCSSSNTNFIRSVEKDKVSTKFHRVDFLMIQEAWSSYYNKNLMKELHTVYPYIVHNTGVHSFSNNKFVLNSGLMVASRFPIISVDVKSFENYCKHGCLTAQGVLMVQVCLGNENGDRRRVGYLFNTHLQSFSEEEKVIPKQMDELLRDTADFIARTKRQNDDVLFSFLCGDFNCDNISSGDKESQEHRLFDVFEDFGRDRPGCDKEWTVGSEMRQLYMFEPLVSTPEGMKRALLNPSLRRRYIVDADILSHTKEALVNNEPPCDQQGNVIESPVGGKRRIDLITFQKAMPVRVESYSFVTRLATLTDHIPVQMEFSCLGRKDN